MEAHFWTGYLLRGSSCFHILRLKAAQIMLIRFDWALEMPDEAHFTGVPNVKLLQDLACLCRVPFFQAPLRKAAT
jgi:hypothetical protein